MAESPREQLPEPRGWPWGAMLTAAIALMFVLAAGFVQFKPNLFQHLFGDILPPPRVTLQEAYEEKPGGPSFDHSALDRLLKAHVDQEGWVDYQGLKADAAELNGYIQAIARASFDEMGRKQKLALLINAYNAFTLRLILDYYPVASIKDIPEDKRWNDERWHVGGHQWSLLQIENEEIRPKFIEPRLHFALVCAAIGCPKLRNEAYQADRLEQQLEDQARLVHSHRRWFRFDPGDGILHLTQLYLWYSDDFAQVAASVPAFAARYAPDLKKELDQGRQFRIKWLGYDWRLNSKENRP